MADSQTDLKNTLIMLSKSDEIFSKVECGDDFIINLTKRKIEMHFKKDGSFWFMNIDHSK